MRKQRFVRPLLLLALTLGHGAAHAEGPPGPPGHGKPGEHGKHEAPGAPGKADDNPEKASERREGKGDKPDSAEHSGAGDMKGLIRELKTGKLKQAEVKERLAKLKDTRDERGQKHREELKQRFGSALAAPAAREELEHHARRIARLDRAMLVCESETVKDKDKLKERIQKLIDKENARHQQAMEHLKSMPASAASASASAAAPAPSAAASAAEKGADK